MKSCKARGGLLNFRLRLPRDAISIRSLYVVRSQLLQLSRSRASGTTATTGYVLRIAICINVNPLLETARRLADIHLQCYNATITTRRYTREKYCCRCHGF